MKAKLLARTIKTLLPRDKPYEVHDTELKGFLLRVQPSGAMTYYLAYRTSDGKKKRIRIARHGAATPVQARDAAEKLVGKILAGQDVQADKQQARRVAEQAKARTLRGFIESKYASWVKAERKTGAAMVQRIRHNFSDLLERPLEKIDMWVIEKWRSEQIKVGKAKTSINRDVVGLKACLSKAVEWEIIDSHPLAGLKPLKTDNRPIARYLTAEEEKSLRQALDAREARLCRERDSANKWRAQRGYPEFPDLNQSLYIDHLKPMVLLAMNTGLRRGELFNLTWNDINFPTRTLTVHGSQAKSGHTRHIPLNAEAMEVLSGWRTNASGYELVFPGKEGKPLDNVRRSWGKVLEDAKIKSFRWHDLRHHFASKLVMAGVDLNTVRELLGHADLTMTLRYAHLSPDHKAEAVARLCKQVG